MTFKKMFGFAAKVIAIASICAAASAETMTYTGPGTTQADTQNAKNLSLNVSDPGTIGDLSVYVNLGSLYGDDVTISLIHSGVTVKLYSGHGDTLYSPIQATFTNSATTAAPYNGPAIGTFLPAQSLSAFDGMNLAGLWTLRTQDFIVPGDGTPLYSWSITATTVPEPAPLALLGLGLMGIVALRRKSAKQG